MKSIMGKVVDSRFTFRFARVLKPSGWRGGYKRTGVQTGYHKMMPLADRRELADRLQRQASR